MSSTTKVQQRTYKACQGCKEKRIRCDLGSFERPTPPCRACAATSQSCVFVEGKRRKRKTHQASLQQPSEVSDACKVSFVQPQQGPPECEQEQSASNRPMHDATSPLDCNGKVNLASAEIHTGLGALNLLALSMPLKSNDDLNLNAHNSPAAPASASLQTSIAKRSLHLYSTPKEEVDADADKSWQRFKLIRRGIITQQETCTLMDFYCQKLSDLIPLLPKFYTRPENYIKLATNEPVLLGAIIVIASRFTTLEGKWAVLRTERIHFRAWRWVKAMLSSTMWGSVSSRTLGTVSAFLLFIEWEIKPSHFAGDVAGDIDDDDFADFGGGFDQVTWRRNGRFDLFAPAFRSNQSAWMMLANALALAQDLECYGAASHYMGNELLAGSEVVDVTEWKRRILYFSYIIDEELSVRLRRTPLLPTAFRRVIEVQSVSVVTNEWWKHNLALANLISFARETLYSCDSSFDQSGSERQLVIFFGQLEISLSQWWNTYKTLGGGVTSLRAFCIQMDFHYTRLYAFSFALRRHSLSRIGTNFQEEVFGQKRHEDILAPYLDETEAACIASLTLIVEDSQNSYDLRYAPVKTILQTVCASVYLIKAMLIRLIDDSQHYNISDLIRRSTSALRGSALDDLHMCLNYATFIDSLLESTLSILLKRNEGQQNMASGYEQSFRNFASFGLASGTMENTIMLPLLDESMTAQWADENGLAFDWGQASGFDLLDNLLTQPIN